MRSRRGGRRPALLMLATVAALALAAARGAAVAEPNAADLRQDLAAAELHWIAGKTGWKSVSVPRIEVRSSRDLATLFFGNPEGYEGVRPLALYARDQHILFLADELALDNLLDQSILLHELVHHMQVSNDIDFDCREVTERQAYRLQADWLREHGVVQPYAFMGILQAQIDGLACP